MIKKKFEELDLGISFEDYDRVFEISSMELDKVGIFTKALVRGIVGKLRTYISYLDPFVNTMPNNFYQVTVAKAASEEDKMKAIEAYKLAMELYHKALVVEMKSNEEIKEFLKYNWSKWPVLEKDVMLVLNICGSAWVEKKEEKKSSEYLG